MCYLRSSCKNTYHVRETVLHRLRVVVRDEAEVGRRAAAGQLALLAARLRVDAQIDDGAVLAEQLAQLIVGGLGRHAAEEQLLVVRVVRLLAGRRLERLLPLRGFAAGTSFLGCCGRTECTLLMCDFIHK